MNKISDALNSVNPSDSAKERMYKNILKKAEGEKEDFVVTKKSASKILLYRIVPIAACLCVCIIGLKHFVFDKEASETDPNVQIANPIVTVSSSDDFKALGISLNAPLDAESIEYSIINDEIACITFVLDSHSYTLRAACNSENLSGIYGKTLFSENIDSDTNAVYEITDTDFSIYRSLSWEKSSVYYVLYTSDDVSLNEIKSVYMYIK